MGEKAPQGAYPWQRGDQHPPTGVVLVYGDEEVPVVVEWDGWEKNTRTQNFRIVPPERTDRPTSLKAATWPGKTGLAFPGLAGMPE